MSTGVELIRERARLLPDEPGVYVYRDDDGQVLYVGKAKGLLKRVGSYARPDRGLERKTAELVLRIAEIDVTITGTETEALLLEQTLIKQHRPPFNVRLRDDKSYPMIAVTTGEPYPRVLFTRRGDRRNARLFGPYPSAGRVRETLEVLNRVFPYRPCQGPKPGRHSGSPCLDLHIGRCLAPCVGLVSQEDYAVMIAEVIRFLEGDTRTIQRQLEAEMASAATEQRYEDAARARNRLAAVRMLDERQLVDRADSGDADVLGVALGDDVAVVHVWPQRGGRLAERVEFIFDSTQLASLDDVVLAAVEERYGAGAAIPPLLLLPAGIERREQLSALLHDRRGASVELRSPERGEWRRLQELAPRNAELALGGIRLQDERSRTRGAEALEELRDEPRRRHSGGDGDASGAHVDQATAGDREPAEHRLHGGDDRERRPGRHRDRARGQRCRGRESQRALGHRRRARDRAAAREREYLVTRFREPEAASRVGERAGQDHLGGAAGGVRHGEGGVGLECHGRRVGRRALVADDRQRRADE